MFSHIFRRRVHEGSVWKTHDRVTKEVEKKTKIKKNVEVLRQKKTRPECEIASV